MSIISGKGVTFGAETDVLVIGGGACGLVAALAATDAGARVVVLERDDSPSGSTAMSSGFIPAPGTQAQRGIGVTDTPEIFAADIQAKAHGSAPDPLVRMAAQEIGPAMDWLAEAHGLSWQVLDDFLYPGHSRHRMHAVPEKTGEALMARLLTATENAGVPVLTGALVTTLFADERRVAGVEITRPDGTGERIGCRALVLACNGYGANRELVAAHIPVMADAPYYGHAGNTGDALIWGQALGGAARCLSAAQGHGSLAHPHGILITWALMMEGGVQVNTAGERFSNEHQGYSEQSTAVLAQPGGVAWSLFDDRLLDFARGFPDFREAEAAGAVVSGADAQALGAAIGLPEGALARTLAACEGVDGYGRDFGKTPRLSGGLHAVKVTGALFHTQGGLMIDDSARVVREDGTPLPNLYAGGGAACGVSGTEISGYLSGNGLLTAVAFGAVAGRSAAG